MAGVMKLWAGTKLGNEEVVKIAVDAAKKLASGKLSPHETAKAIAIALLNSGDESELPELRLMAVLEDEFVEFGKEYRIKFYGKERASELQIEVEQEIISTAHSVVVKYD